MDTISQAMSWFVHWLVSDWIGVVVNLAFGAMLIPIFLDKQKPPIVTSLGTGALLIWLALGGSYRSPVTASVTFVVGLMWLTIAWLRYKQSH